MKARQMKDEREADKKRMWGTVGQKGLVIPETINLDGRQVFVCVWAFKINFTKYVEINVKQLSIKQTEQKDKYKAHTQVRKFYARIKYIKPMKNRRHKTNINQTYNRQNLST